MDARDGDGVVDVGAQAVDHVDGTAWVDQLRSGSRVRDVTGDNDDEGNDAHRDRVRRAQLPVP